MSKNNDKKDSFILNNINYSKNPERTPKSYKTKEDNKKVVNLTQDNYKLDKFSSIIGKIKSKESTNISNIMVKSPNVTITSSFLKELRENHENKEKSTTPRHQFKNSIIKNNGTIVNNGASIKTSNNNNNTYNSAVTNHTQDSFTSTNASNMFIKQKQQHINDKNNNKSDKNNDDSRTNLKDKYKDKEKIYVSTVSNSNNSDTNYKSSQSFHSIKNDKTKGSNSLNA